MQVDAEETQTSFTPAGTSILLLNQTVTTSESFAAKIKKKTKQEKLTLPVVLGDGNSVSSRLQVVGFDHAHFFLEHLQHTESITSRSSS